MFVVAEKEIRGKTKWFVFLFCLLGTFSEKKMATKKGATKGRRGVLGQSATTEDIL